MQSFYVCVEGISRRDQGHYANVNIKFKNNFRERSIRCQQIRGTQVQGERNCGYSSSTIHTYRWLQAPVYSIVPWMLR
ncbi:hypothetical protein MKX01_028847 [Papaver californicum]|nr:hypothetical protein MKX01_028847 [Papaver californicum]